MTPLSTPLPTSSASRESAVSPEGSASPNPAPSPHPLQHAVWNSLAQGHAALAEGTGPARRFRPAYAPFAAIQGPETEGFEALAGLMAPGEEVAFFTADDISPPAGRFDVTLRKDILQMVGAAPLPPAAAPPRWVRLGAGDVDAMRALVATTQPGPFRERSHELGDFIGIKVDGRLVAMAGERLHLDGFREISAVCTLPEFRGHGHAHELIVAVAHAMVARGQTPFLHVFSDNLAAIALYRKLGFALRQPFRVTVLRRR